MRRSRLGLAALASLGACNHAPAHRVAPVVSADATPTRTCAATYSVSASITGSWFGNPTAAAESPFLVVRLDDVNLGPPDVRRVARIELAKPFFAADVKLNELCSDASAATGPIDVQCVTGAAISRVVVRAAGDGLDAIIDGQPPQHWTLPYSPKGFSAACLTLHGLGAHHDLEPARAAWGRDAPSERCGNAPRTRPVHVAFDFLPPPQPSVCGPGSASSDANELVVSTQGWKRSLGVLSNLCGGLHPLRYSDADAIHFETSDMGTEYRDAYRLGDRLYVVEGGDHITSTDLPCGAKVTFDVRYPHRDGLIEQERRPIRD